MILIKTLNSLYSRIIQTLKHLLKLEQEHGRLFLFVPVFIAFGMAFWFTTTNEIPLLIIVSSCIITAIASLKIRHSYPNISLVISIITYFLIGMTFASFETSRNTTILLSKPITTSLRGVVKWREPMQNGKWRYLIQVAKSSHEHSNLFLQNILLSVIPKHEPFTAGQTIEGIAWLSPLSGPALSGLFDSSFFSYFKGISASGYFYTIPTLYPSLSDNNQKSFLSKIQNFLNELRTKTGEHIRKKLPGDIGSLAAALVTDERRAISGDTTKSLRKSGLAHIIAISGLNMTIAAGLFFLGIRSLFSSHIALTESFPIKKIAAFGALFTVTAYFLISGASVPAQRAYFMTVVTLISYLFDKHSNGLRSIALTAIVIICFSPSEVIGPSFQMSFATTAALIAINTYGKKRTLPHPLLKILPDKGIITTSIIRFIKTVFITSLIGSASASIFLIKYFHCIPLYGLIANLLAIPILSFVVMPSGLIAVLLMAFSLDDIPLHVMGWGLDIVINISNNISKLGGEICIGRISKTSFIFAVIGFILLVFCQTNLRHIGTIMIVFIAIPLAIFFPYPPPDLIVSEDGKLVAFLHKSTLNSNNSNPSQFILSQWETALMAPIYKKPKKLKKKEIPKKIDQDFFKKALILTKPGSFLCIDKLFCTGYHHESGLIVTTLKREEYANLSCQFSDILITEIEGIKSASCGVSLFISPEILREKGSLEIHILPPSNKENDKPSFIVNGAITNPYAPWNKNGRRLMLMPR